MTSESDHCPESKLKVFACMNVSRTEMVVQIFVVCIRLLAASSLPDYEFLEDVIKLKLEHSGKSTFYLIKKKSENRNSVID